MQHGHVLEKACVFLYDCALSHAATYCLTCKSAICIDMQMRKVLAAQQQLPVQQSTCIESLQNLTGLSQRTVASALQACCLKELSVEAATASSTSGGKAQDAIPLIDQMSSNGMLEQQPDLQDPMADCWMAQTLMEGALQKLPDAEATVLHHVYGLQDGLPKSRPQVSHFALNLENARSQTGAVLKQSCMHLWAVSILQIAASPCTLSEQPRARPVLLCIRSSLSASAVVCVAMHCSCATQPSI